jgi:hypothetical protein
MNDVTPILSAIEQGDPRAAEQLLPLVYDELRELAAALGLPPRLADRLRAFARAWPADARDPG